MAMGDHEMEQVAAFMGHTKKTHAEFYRLPQDIYQTAKVAKVLLLMEKGQGDKFGGKNLNEIDIAPEIYDSSESEYEDYDDEPIVQKVLNRVTRNQETESAENHSHNETEKNYYSKENVADGSVTFEELPSRAPRNRKQDKAHGDAVVTQKNKEPQSVEKKRNLRATWTESEKEITRKHFSKHIQNKIAPKKLECEQFLEAHSQKFGSKNWLKIKTFVYNAYRLKE
nr:unnamed protein product [Callosobruchus analis]